MPRTCPEPRNSTKSQPTQNRSHHAAAPSTKSHSSVDEPKHRHVAPHEIEASAQSQQARSRNQHAITSFENARTRPRVNTKPQSARNHSQRAIATSTKSQPARNHITRTRTDAPTTLSTQMFNCNVLNSNENSSRSQMQRNTFQTMFNFNDARGCNPRVSI